MEVLDMSFTSHNPELYDGIVRKSILRWVDNLMDKEGFSVPGEWLEGYEAFIEAIQNNPQGRSLYDELIRLASKEIVHTEQAYFGELIDHAVEYHKDKAT